DQAHDETGKIRLYWSFEPAPGLYSEFLQSRCDDVTGTRHLRRDGRRRREGEDGGFRFWPEHKNATSKKGIVLDQREKSASALCHLIDAADPTREYLCCNASVG